MAKSKLFAVSQNRYRASALERRLYGGNTVTQFLIGVEGSDPKTWENVMGYGPTPGNRKTYALRAYVKAHPDLAHLLQG